jgi:uncharacterized repeat protein (TIGR01451 family)/fimbrial isopeptide formation D2 family protein
MAMVVGMSALLPASPAQAAPGDLAVSKSGDAAVLVDAPIHYTVKARNAGSSPEYNLSFRDVLPLGVTYVPGSTSAPKGLGDPTIVVTGTAPNQQQTLIWANVSDLPVGAEQSVSFQVSVDPAAYPVGSTVTNTASGYTQANPRLVPKFDGTGTVIAGSYSDSGVSTPFVTSITAITITKSENSPEHELMRGVHDDTATYTLTVTNNQYRATTGNTVIDYLPAALEFLGCGGVDNGATSEYSGRTLAGTPAPSGPCVRPVAVDTIQLAAGNPQGLAAGVYTRVTWQIPDLAAGQTWTTNYRAGIPQRANTMTFAGGAPSAASLGQAANLDNNTGPDTRELASPAGTEDGEQALTNLAQVTGSYTGSIAGNPANKTVLDSSSVTVTAEDLAVQKSVSPGEFAQGGVATYTLHVETSEYARASGVSITDVIPDGLCPLSIGTPGTCAASAADFAATGATVQSITHNADHTWTVVFAPFDQAAQSTATISYKALMRDSYDGHSGAPTVSGDGYTNTVSLVGSTTSLTTVNAPDSGGVTIANVRDASSATIVSSGPSLRKTVMKQMTPYACGAGSYTDNNVSAGGTASTDGALRFRVGDRVCFTVRVDFSTGNSTKDPSITDFLPAYVQYEAGSAAPTANNTVATVGNAPTVDGGQLVWQVGTTSSGARFVAKGGVFEWTLSGTIIQEPAATPRPDITANLAKLTWTDSGNQVGFLRDQVDFSVGATPPVGIAKSHTGSSTVAGGAQVPFTIQVTNQGSTANNNAVPMHDILVRDVLPTGIACTAISAITNAGTCSGSAPSVLEWTLPGPLAAGANATVGYTMTIPATPRVLTDYVNTTGVVSYQTDTNLGTPITHYPANTTPQLTACGNDPLPGCDVPLAQTTDKVTVANTSLAKTVVTAISETNNNAATQTVIGEQLTYTVKATVPANTSVYQGVISDPMPTGIELLSATADLDGGPLPGGATLTVNTRTDPGADSATITLPATYANATAADQVFTLTITARVTTAAGNTHGTSRTNTASFVRKDAPTGGVNLTAQTAAAATTVIEPNPKLAKTHTPSGTVAGGQTLTYTLTATNPATAPAPNARPPLHDAYVVDCVPAGLQNLIVTSVGATTSITTGDGSNGCAAGMTLLHWSVGDLDGGASKTLTYTAVVDPAAVGGQVYTNTATIIGTDLNDGVEPATAIERQYSAPASDQVTVAGSTLTKTNDTPLRAVGEQARFTVTATVPADVNYWDATIVDTLPAGLDATDVVLTASTCTLTGGGNCPITPVSLTPNGQKIGWSLGDLTALSQTRTIVLTYTVAVADRSGLSAGANLTNSALLGWKLTNGPDPTDVNGTPDSTAGPALSTVQVTEPSVSITKQVSNTHPNPEGTFTYTVAVTNANTATTSTAYQIVVHDVVPSGVIVDAATLTNGGTIAGADPQLGGGTITWTLPSLAKGATTSLTYSASLASPAPSATLTNTATVSDYCSIAVTDGQDCQDQGGRHYTGPSATAAVSALLPHVSVAKAAVGGDLAYLGAPKTFQITITSDGVSTAYRVTATDTLPANWAYQADSAQVSIDGGAPTQTNPVVSGQSLSWGEFAQLAVGKTIVITYGAIPQDPAAASNPGVGHSIDHTNTAAVTGRDANGQIADREGHPFHGPDASAVVHIDSADLGIVKTPVGAPVAGRDLSWTLTVSNHGPDTAVGPFTVTDPMPTQLTSLSATGTGWTCSVAADTITCARTNSTDTLANGASFPAITVTGRVPAGIPVATHLANTAQVDAETYDPDPDNNQDGSDVQVTGQADMTIDKQLSGTMVAGNNATYTLTVTNLGPSVHRGPLVVTDTVPAGTTFVSASGAGWSCTTPAVGATGLITCTRSDDIPLGAVDQIVLVVHVDSGRTTAVTNSGTVTGDNPGGTPDPNHDNDTDTVTTTPGTSADLSINKSRVSDADFIAGHDATYRLTVHNNGLSDAQNVVVTDTLPSYLTYVGTSPATGAWTCATSGQTVTCTLTGPLAASPGSSSGDVALLLTVHVADDYRDQIQNTARVASTTPDPDPDNNTDTDTLSTNGVSSDLSITKTHPAGPVVAGGGNVTYTLTVTNHGASAHLAADGPITVTDAMPTGMSCVSVTGGACSTETTGSYTYTGNLAVNASFTVTVVAHIAADAGPASLVNTATVAGPNDDNPTNNTAIDTTTVIDQANVSITKTATGADPVRAGQNTTFRLTAHNDGPSDADDVTVTDTLPADMTLVSIAGTGWNCTATTLSCTLPSLAAGASSSITVTVRISSGVAEATTLTNHASVSTSTDGDNPVDNQARADVHVVAEADLVLHKAHPGNDTVLAGTDTTYTLDVANNGPSDAQGPITLTDTLPQGMRYLSTTSDGDWSCSAVGQTVTCTIDGPLLAGTAIPTLALLVHIDADTDAATNVVNHAHMEGTTTDPNPDNNDDQASITISQGADVSIVKSHTGIGVIGQQVDFTLAVANAGPSDARTVVVTDVLPAGLDYVSAGGTAEWACTYDDGTRAVECAHSGPMVAGTSAADIHLIVTVTAQAYPGVDNTATVSTSTPEQDPDNNTSTDHVDVQTLADLGIVKTLAGQLVVGQQAHYTLTVHDAGPTEATGTVTVTDTLPTGLTFVSATGQGWSCQNTSGLITCTRTGLADGATSVIDVVVTVGPQAYPSVTNVGTVTASDPDPNPDNNRSEDPRTVTPVVNLALAKTVAYQHGNTVAWDITVTNHGPNTTVDAITVIDTLPKALSYVSATGPGWDCGAVAGIITCARNAVLPVDATATVQVVTTLDATAGEQVRNIATLIASGNGKAIDADATVVIEADAVVQTPNQDLAHTGTDIARLTAIALALLLAGAGALILGRRRRA